MTAPNRLTDRGALTAHRARAARDPALFLQDAVAREVEERLQEVNKTFTDVAIVTGWPAVWADRIPGARLVADEPTLDLAEGSCDLVIHHLGLHWADDPVGQLVQARRALRPDGLLIATLFGGQTLHELRAALGEAEIAVMGGLSPRVAPMAEIRDLGGLLQRAGLALPVADTQTLTVTYADLTRLMHDLRAMGENNALAARLRHATPRAVFARAQTLYHRHFAHPDGRLPATFDVVTLTGWAPANDQPQPLRPGSATARLADVLGVAEHNPESSKS